MSLVPGDVGAEEEFRRDASQCRPDGVEHHREVRARILEPVHPLRDPIAVDALDGKIAHLVGEEIAAREAESAELVRAIRGDLPVPRAELPRSGAGHRSGPSSFPCIAAILSVLAGIIQSRLAGASW